MLSNCNQTNYNQITILQFSCSFFLQGEGTPNGRLRERAGRLDVLDVAWGSAGLAMIGDCDHRWSLLGDCCPESGSWERQLPAGGGGSRSFGGVAEILSSLGLLGLRGSERRRGAMRQRNRLREREFTDVLIKHIT